MDPSMGGSGSLSGIELLLNCRLFKAPDCIIRQLISHASYDGNGRELDSLELNAHCLIGLAPDLALGFDPGYVVEGYIYRS